MCGICGKIDFQRGVRAAAIQRMCDVLAHRGPDDQGMLFIKRDRYFEARDSSVLGSDENGFEVGLGHRRLSIIDLSETAHQPMGNEDRTIWIVYNGEVYNFQDLRNGLEEKGHLFRSRSDTEVILHAYEEWGVDCLNRLRGMFSFAIWDTNRKRLFVARDRLGKKPLVYLKKNGCFWFASEIKAILQDPDVDRKVDTGALHHYLTYQYVSSPDTIFEGVKKLPPAHYLLYDQLGNIQIERYWRLSFAQVQEREEGLSGLCDLIRTELEESVRLRLISDVPVGAFLSGGIDSSLIVGLMAKHSEKPVKTFSIGFDEEGFDELPYARLISNRFATEHHEFVVKPNAIEVLPKLIWHYNEPFADSSAIPTYYVAKMTKDFVKVVLTGDAGDENFAGYHRYLRSKWVALFTKLPEKMRRQWFPALLRGFAFIHPNKAFLNRLADFVESLSDNQVANYLQQIKIFNAREKEDLYTPDFVQLQEKTDPVRFLLNKYEEAETKDPLERLLYVDITSYLPEDLLVKIDIATMANSLEARVPFLDHKFMEFVAGIPSRLKLRGSITKFALKEAFSGFLPGAILKREKMGFGVPISKWFRKELKSYVFETLMDRRALDRGFFRKEGIQRLLDDHMALKYDHSARIWALLALELWFRIFIDRKGDTGSYAA